MKLETLVNEMVMVVADEEIITGRLFASEEQDGAYNVADELIETDDIASIVFRTGKMTVIVLK